MDTGDPHFCLAMNFELIEKDEITLYLRFQSFSGEHIYLS